MSSTPAPLENDDLLQEILLRLPPTPSTLSRAALVCTRWRGILSDPRFLRSFSRHHPDPPLLGFFKEASRTSLLFVPALDPPDRIPAGRFFVPEKTWIWHFFGCRHGFAVMLSEYHCEAFVWDPLNGHQHRVPFPPELRDVVTENHCMCSATVMWAADDQNDGGHAHDDGFTSPSFKLILLCTSRDLKTASACVYESASGAWGNIASTACKDMVMQLTLSVLIGRTLYWMIHGREILAFDTQRQALAVMDNPAGEAQSIGNYNYRCFQLFRTGDDGTGLGLAVVSKLGIHIWERKLNSDGVAGWVLLQKITELDGIDFHAFQNAAMVGYDEESNVAVLSTHCGCFVLHLESMRTRLISQDYDGCHTSYFPYRNFYTAGRGVGWKWVDPGLNKSNLQTVKEWCNADTSQPDTCRKAFNSLKMLISSAIWNKRNARVFHSKASLPTRVVATIREEARTWVVAGARFLGNISPGE